VAPVVSFLNCAFFICYKELELLMARQENMSLEFKALFSWRKLNGINYTVGNIAYSLRPLPAVCILTFTGGLISV
jgi:hypothetical protein